jgi:hypothetical protein
VANKVTMSAIYDPWAKTTSGFVECSVCGIKVTPPNPRTELAREETGDGFVGKVVGLCPSQGEGTVDGHFWHLYSRDGASFAVAATPEHAKALALEVLPVPLGWALHEDLDYETIGAAWDLIRSGITRWRAAGRPIW